MVRLGIFSALDTKTSLWAKICSSKWEPQLAELLSKPWERHSPSPFVVLSRGGFYPQGRFKGEGKPKEGKDEGGKERLIVFLHSGDDLG